MDDRDQGLRVAGRELPRWDLVDGQRHLDLLPRDPTADGMPRRQGCRDPPGCSGVPRRPSSLCLPGRAHGTDRRRRDRLEPHGRWMDRRQELRIERQAQAPGPQDTWSAIPKASARRAKYAVSTTRIASAVPTPKPAGPTQAPRPPRDPRAYVGAVGSATYRPTIPGSPTVPVSESQEASARVSLWTLATESAGVSVTGLGSARARASVPRSRT